ncbi:MAG: response regulator [Desulfobacteraceae bacterium]|nr:MAG: response regulator [Desulfobacteraceae bacterium]
MNPKKETILIIDDELSIRHSLASYFEDEGYHVLTAENGQAGLDIMYATHLDIILTDLRMPVMDGLEVMKAVQDHDPQIPMVVVSGAGRKEDIINALRMGAKDYITKPVGDLNMIRHVVTRVLENARLTRENKAYRLQLEKSEKQYRTITENIGEGVFTADKDENLTYINQAFCDILGYTKAELRHKNLKDLSSEESFDTILKQTQIREQGLTSRYEVQLIHKAGHPVHAEFVCSPLSDDGSPYSGAIAVVRDISYLIELRQKYNEFRKSLKENPDNLIPICASCKNIRKDENHWIPIEEHFRDKIFSHGICPECFEKLYPGYDLDEEV